MKVDIDAPIAQLVEQAAVNRWVGGSSPSGSVHTPLAQLADALDLGSR